MAQCGGYSVPPHISGHCQELGEEGFVSSCGEKNGGGSRLLLCIGSGGRFLTSLMFPVHCCASNSQLHPSVAGKMRGRGSEREQSVFQKVSVGVLSWGVPFLNQDTGAQPEGIRFEVLPTSPGFR